VSIQAPQWISVAGILVVALLCGFQTIGDWDFWWHLTVGEWVFTHRAVPTTDVFSWSWDGAPWHYRDAGAELLWYLSWYTGGFVGVAVVRTVAVLVAAGLLWRTGAGSLCTPALVAVIAAAAPAAWLPRPLLAGSVGLLLLLTLTHRQWQLSWPDAVDARGDSVAATDADPARVGGWWAMAATLALWFQMHRSAVIGVAFLGAFAALYWVRRWASDGMVRSIKELAHALSAVVVAVTSGLCTPNGTSLYGSTLRLQGNEELQAAISEWQPMTADVLRQHYPALAGLALVACVVAFVRVLQPLLRRQWGRACVELWPALVLGVLVWQTSGAVRHAVLLAVAVAWVLARTAGPALQVLTHARSGVAVSISVAGAVLAITLTVQSMMHPLGAGPVSQRYPEGALQFAQQHQLGERVHNSFVYGGYVLWSSRRQGTPMRVLIDGRNETVYPVPFYLACVEAQFDPRAFLALRERFAGDWVLADNAPGREAFGFLFRDPRWAMIYWSEQAVVYVPRDRIPPGVEPFRYLDPLAPAPSLAAALQATDGDPQARGRLDGELTRMLSTSPDSLRAMSMRLLYLHATGQAAAGEFTTLWDQTRATHPSHPMLATLRQLLGLADETD